MLSFRIILCAIAVLCFGCASSEEVLPKEDLTDAIRVAIPIYKNPQPDALGSEIYEEMSRYFYQETGKRLHVKMIRLDQLESFEPALLHMVGSREVQLEPWERHAIHSQQMSGGTVLIENYKGVGVFAISMRDQLESIFVSYDEPVSTRCDIITGRKLPEGAKSNRRLTYRNVPEEFRGRMLLRGTEQIVWQRYPILIAYEDLSHAMQGIDDPLVNGYSIESARKLMLNILLEADQSKKSQVD